MKKYKLVSFLDKKTVKKLYNLKSDLEMTRIFRKAKQMKQNRPSLAA